MIHFDVDPTPTEVLHYMEPFIYFSVADLSVIGLRERFLD